ncbi:hypothetical protein AWB67_03235 [Caballeronia terrestris]|uniref:Uncharacterized protein n=1 Tax=Caballeronia terrestris TaxID=1226301 RepID=A0A158J3L4_9BURK|nr:hypothetical protein AWB67_03235 [Caballeronia terrestris]
MENVDGGLRAPVPDGRQKPVEAPHEHSYLVTYRDGVAVERGMLAIRRARVNPVWTICKRIAKSSGPLLNVRSWIAQDGNTELLT